MALECSPEVDMLYASNSFGGVKFDSKGILRSNSNVDHKILMNANILPLRLTVLEKNVLLVFLLFAMGSL